MTGLSLCTLRTCCSLCWNPMILSLADLNMLPRVQNCLSSDKNPLESEANNVKVSSEASEVQSVPDLSAQSSHPLDTHNTITNKVQIGVFVVAENSNKNGSALHVSNYNTIMVENRSVLYFGLKMTNYSMLRRHNCYVLCPDFITAVITYNVQQKPWTSVGGSEEYYRLHAQP